ncbi:Membrane glycoprotein [Myxococcus hansupus]|uniref:Membrane glycoprotein n=1 Tax=Pseudomyxococcus hansupus TaxID=1297742 RepID=A0A0H4X834_9BACT|nr:Membrane glycoprotein [Myxococcus hansupus]
MRAAPHVAAVALVTVEVAHRRVVVVGVAPVQVAEAAVRVGVVVPVPDHGRATVVVRVVRVRVVRRGRLIVVDVQVRVRAPAAAEVIGDGVVARVAVLDDLDGRVTRRAVDVGDTASAHHQGNRNGKGEQAAHVMTLLGGSGRARRPPCSHARETDGRAENSHPDAVRLQARAPSR